MTNLDLFIALHTAYRDMAVLAEANEWDQLAELERQAAHVKQELELKGGIKHCNPAEQAKVRELVDQTLEFDERIRTHVNPWMDHVRSYLSAITKENAVKKAYGQF